MSKTIQDDVLELVKPAIQKRIEELVESAFKLAAFGGCPDVLEKAIDTCSSKHFEDDLGSVLGQPMPGGGLALASIPNPTRVGKNIVVGGHDRPLIKSVVPGRSPSLAPGEVVKASSYSKLGRPLSRYAGVAYSGKISSPWLARYGNIRLGTFTDEVEAAKAYDKARMQDGKSPKNFEV